MASRIVVVSRWPFNLSLGSRSVTAMRMHVSMLYIKTALAHQVSDEHAWNLLSLLEALRQTLAPDLFALLLNVADKLFRECAIVQSRIEVACCEGVVRGGDRAEPVVLRLMGRMVDNGVGESYR